MLMHVTVFSYHTVSWAAWYNTWLLMKLTGERCSLVFSFAFLVHNTEEKEGFYNFLPADTADRLCQSWQSCSNHHEI